ncbi:hypothetical protein [Lysinibacillus xylanilyticus]|uniref:hypothetical protein n=1 Tax=Lysinibacillus xylanilyticus TaxID=582475 RepID=UPI003803A8D1
MRKRSANVAAANVLSVRKRSDSNNNSGGSGSTLAHRKASSLERKSPSFIAPQHSQRSPLICFSTL